MWDTFFVECVLSDQCYSKFLNTVFSLINKHVPIEHLKYRDSLLAWKHPRHIIALKNKKAAIWKQMRDMDLVPAAMSFKYKKLSKQFKSELRVHRLSVENKILRSNGRGSFFKYVNSKLKSKPVKGPIQDASENIVTECSKKTDTFNKFFASVFILDNRILPLLVKRAEPGIKISDVSFGANQVLRLLVKQKSKTSVGPDELPSIINFLQQIGSLFSFSNVNQVCLHTCIWQVAFYLEAGNCYSHPPKKINVIS